MPGTSRISAALVVLGGLGGDFSYPLAIAANGIVGGATTAVAINGAGQIAGNISAGTTVHAALWADFLSDPVDLGTFGGASSSAADLDDAGQVVGTASYADGSQRKRQGNPCP